MDNNRDNNKEKDIMTYCLAPQVHWSVESEGVLVMNSSNGRVCKLGYPKAAIWDLIQRSYSFEKTVTLVAAITSANEKPSEELLLQLLDEWTEQGYMVRRVSNG